VFTLNAYPNPTQSAFTIKLESSVTTEKVRLRVYDLSGRTVQVMNGLSANQTIQVGVDYRPGVYFIEMIQGTQRKQLKLIKQPD